MLNRTAHAPAEAAVSAVGDAEPGAAYARLDPPSSRRSTAAIMASKIRLTLWASDAALALALAFAMVVVGEPMLAAAPLLWYVLSALRSSRMQGTRDLVSLTRLRNFHAAFTLFVLFIGVAVGDIHNVRVVAVGLFALGCAAAVVRWTIPRPTASRILNLDHRESVLVVGNRDAVDRTIREFAEVDYLTVMGVCLPSGDNGPTMVGDVPVLGQLGDVNDVTRLYHPDLVAVHDVGMLGGRQLARLQWALEDVGSELAIVTPMTNTGVGRTRIRTAGRRVMVDVAHHRPSGTTAVVKACIDRLVGAVALLVASPVLAVCALGVKLSSPGPVIFKQVRIREGDRPFNMYKFRTMRQDAEALRRELEAENEVGGGLFKMRHDPRITTAGKWLRRLSLDELPQLWNVVRGDMSLIGPRPALPNEVALYDEYARRRLAVKPGLTGLWQVSGRSNLSWEETVRIDADYVDNWRPGRDVSIALRTVKAVLGREGAY